MGWVIAGFGIGLAGLSASASIFTIAAVGSFVLGIYSLSLPSTPPPEQKSRFSLGDLIGAKAFVLFKNRNFTVLILCSLLTSISLGVYNSFAASYPSVLGISEVMPDRIVDGFESNQINAHDRQATLASTTDVTIKHQPLFKRYTVKQPGQPVMAGVEAQLALEMLLFADVPGNSKYPDDLSVDHDRQVRDGHGQQFFTFVENPCLETLRLTHAHCEKMLVDPF